MHFVPVGSWQVLNEEGRRKYVTDSERSAFLKVADRAAPHHRALAYVLAFSGCRVSEALNLTRHQIDADQKRLVFRTLKRRRLVYRAVPVPVAIIEMIMALPPAEDNRVWRMHRATAYRFIHRTMEEALIQGPMACCRGLRHGYGILAASRNVPPNLITKFMGHANGSTTAIYLDAVGWEERSFAERMWDCEEQQHWPGLHDKILQQI